MKILYFLIIFLSSAVKQTDGIFNTAFPTSRFYFGWLHYFSLHTGTKSFQKKLKLPSTTHHRPYNETGVAASCYGEASQQRGQGDWL